MDSKILIINLFKVIIFTLITIVIVNLIGFIFEIFQILNDDKPLESFEYSNFKFYLNGKETYNQFEKKYFLINILIFLIYFYLLFKELLIRFFKSY
ncbi:Uncharacterised protein [Chryseobacterium taihuense]|uniref:Uncharacterized protein n=1 Tax=Chryseobacterium taihuense TaxID=1141221 RepID=A0A4U8WPJ2_9FLAO|nr:Uncharacterised protein [Chryseobacterium taihuense]